MDELLNDFLVETNEHIEAADVQLVLFEKNPGDKSIVASIFRLLHTIKGTCGFLGLSRLEHLSHAAEALISRLREGAAGTAEIVSSILIAVDRIKFILKELEQSGQEPGGDDHDLIGVIEGQIEKSYHDDKPAEDPNSIETAIGAELAKAGEAGARKPATETGNKRTETVRVAVDMLEQIMLLVSELVLTRNQLLDLSRISEDEATKAPLQRLSALTTDLQDKVMRARMQPVERLFANLPRLVRDLSLELGKKLELVTNGGDTELDRQLIELIRDPLTHLLRNCADHGIEQVQDRLAAGKPAVGTIQVIASHHAGFITIEVSDDGRGLDISRIRSKALAQGLTTATELATLSDEEISRFIFLPAFSTADTVTSISGRGIGMDVVRENIEEIGGSISLTSVTGKGTKFSLKIPLTLAIMPALIVHAGMHRFALPQHSVVEVVGINENDTRHEIDHVRGSLVLRLRNEVLPLTDLRQVLSIEPGQQPGREDRAVVMRIGTQSFAILVDAVADVKEVVVKPLGASIAHITAFSGQTILGDGSVVLILDPTGIASLLGLTQSSDYKIITGTDGPSFSASTRIVLFRAGPGAIKAIPLSLITRIEMIQKELIEQSDDVYVMRHQNHLMLLLPVGELSDRPEHPVLVLSVGGESMGLLVDEIHDIVEETLDVEIASTTPGIIGSVRIRDMVVELIDVAHFMRIGRPDAFARQFTRRFRILLVDDKLFFRDMLSPVLKAAGYDVTCAESGEEALSLFTKGQHFDAVVTDIEMPNMSGYTLARTLTSDERHKDLPVVALAAHASPTIEQAAAASGMCKVVGKFDRTALLHALEANLQIETLGNYELERRLIGGLAA